jgi:DNA-binding CsgD family transcriptional regulator
MHTWCGDFETASALVAEQDAVTEVTGIRMASYGGQLLAAYKGHPYDLEPVAIGRELPGDGDGYSMQVALAATAILNNGLGRYADAFAAAREVAFADTFLEPLVISELIEASVRIGGEQAADEALQRLLAVTVAGSDWAEGIEARGRALCSAGDVAEHWYSESITSLARTRLRPELARSHLLYGEWLRRQNRRVDARAQLRVAYDIFGSIGADGFAERTRNELLATGEKVRKRGGSAHNELTTQEAHIARLARDGRTNAEIGAEMFISVRTVEWHLRKVFAKLGISSRRGLAQALPSQGRQPEPPSFERAH